MTDESALPTQESPAAGARRAVTRRGLLQAGGAVAAGAVGVSRMATVSAQESGGAKYTTQGVIPVADEFADSDYTGLFIHVGERGTADLEASEIEGCEFDNWSVEEVNVFDSMLIDRIEGSQKEVPTQMYTADQSLNIDPGSLFVVNQVRSCPEGYVGLQLEGLGYDLGSVDDSTATADSGAAADEPTAGAGPGFGVGGALAGAGGLGALLQHLRSGDGD